MSKAEETLVKPSGRVPEAMVAARHGTGMVTRAGRGFSTGELSGAGLDPRLAARWGARIDLRRRSVLDGNVGSLKAWHSQAGAKPRVAGEVRKIEEEVEKAGREVKREAAAAKKEAARVEKAVKKEVKRAEKAVKEKVEKPKARPKKKAKS